MVCILTANLGLSDASVINHRNLSLFHRCRKDSLPRTNSRSGSMFFAGKESSGITTGSTTVCFLSISGKFPFRSALENDIISFG